MKRLLTVTFTGAAALTATLIVVVSASGHPGTASGRTTVVVTAHQSSFHATGTGPGSIITFTDDLVAHGKKIGRDQVGCLATGPGSSIECYATAFLPKGNIESMTAFDPVHQRKVTIGIVGGTRAYRDAGGVIDVTVITPTKMTYAYHIDP
jgi:hypothetical protein